jgi:hypothetical protein
VKIENPQTIRKLRAAETFLMFAESLARMSDEDGDPALQDIADRRGRAGALAVKDVANPEWAIRPGHLTVR